VDNFYEFKTKVIAVSGRNATKDLPKGEFPL
jgi:hypothetical protein